MRLYEEACLLSSTDLMQMAMDAGNEKHDPSNGQFTSSSGGAGKSPRSKNAKVQEKVDTEHSKLAAAGFKYEKSIDDPQTSRTLHHYAHQDGSRAVVTEHHDPVSGRTKVSSYTNTTNKGKGEKLAPAERKAAPKHTKADIQSGQNPLNTMQRLKSGGWVHRDDIAK